MDGLSRWIDRWKDGWVDGCKVGWVHVHMDSRKDNTVQWMGAKWTDEGLGKRTTRGRSLPVWGPTE